MQRLRSYLPIIIGIALGAIGGYFWYDYNKCASGTCPITSHPLNSIIYGAVVGGLFFSSFKQNKKQIQSNEQTDNHH